MTNGDNSVRIVVSDNNVGISKENLKNLQLRIYHPAKKTRF